MNPTVSLQSNPAQPAEGSTIQLNVNSTNATSVAYSCRSAVDGKVVKQGSTAPGVSQVQLTIVTDTICDVVATNATGGTANASITIPVSCGNKLKVGGKCQEFACKEVRPIAAVNGILQIPQRTTEGLCFSIKLMNRISASNSSLTPTLDTSITSRNHDIRYNDSFDVRTPYLMGRRQLQFRLAGARQVKLAGAADSRVPILVDNFVLVGIHPASIAPDSGYFRAYGTADSTVHDSTNILLNRNPVPLTAFATGGTSTITPLDVTTQIQPNETYKMDVRSLDCGAAREMSDIFLVFQ